MGCIAQELDGKIDVETGPFLFAGAAVSERLMKPSGIVIVRIERVFIGGRHGSDRQMGVFREPFFGEPDRRKGPFAVMKDEALRADRETFPTEWRRAIGVSGSRNCGGGTTWVSDAGASGAVASDCAAAGLASQLTPARQDYSARAIDLRRLFRPDHNLPIGNSPSDSQ